MFDQQLIGVFNCEAVEQKALADVEAGMPCKRPG